MLGEGFNTDIADKVRILNGGSAKSGNAAELFSQPDADGGLIRDASTNWSVVYKYEPLPNYTGTDFVEIETCSGGESTGCSSVETVRINFTITN
jgi:hypothetical protein